MKFWYKENLSACLVRANSMLKGMRSSQQIFIVKLNKVEEPKDSSNIDWLHKFSYVFPKDLMDLPPSCEIHHDINILPGNKQRDLIRGLSPK